jgi:hypothetical protein
MRGKCVRRSHIPSAPPGYAWLLDVLFGRTPAVTWAASGELPAGFRVAEQFAVIAAGGGRNLMVSLGVRRGASSALTSYNALRSPRRRIARRALGAGLRTGLAQPLLPVKIDVGTAVDATPDQLASALLTEHLRELFGRGPVAVAVSGGIGPYRKPVLQVFSADGTPTGYVKVGWNSWTRDAVRREAAALRACAARGPRQFGVPALLDHYTWRALDFLVTAPIPLRVRRLANSSPLPDVGVLREITRLSEPHTGELATSSWWIGLRARIAGAADPPVRAQLDEVADHIERADGNATLEFGFWHGDFAPWNLARLGSRLFAWDWEDSAPSAPVGFDALHFHFQVAFVARQLPLEQAALSCLKARPALEALGISADRHHLMASLHLLELAVRHAEASSSAGKPDERFYPAVIGVLNQSLQVPPGAGRLRCSGPSS